MKKLKRDLPLTEIQEFHQKFPDKKLSYSIFSDNNGRIISIETDNKEIIKYVKQIGLE
jgi:hypothetical protein|tara:strand:- start:814 stop:987 length:174 start_codon:yes stop_codon:yes gene_type:complete